MINLLQTPFRTPRTLLEIFSGADGGSRVYGSASLAEVLSRQAHLEVLAARGCQGVIDHLRNRDIPPQFVLGRQD